MWRMCPQQARGLLGDTTGDEMAELGDRFCIGDAAVSKTSAVEGITCWDTRMSLVFADMTYVLVGGTCYQ
jgi:hypothetical protein